LLKTQCEKPLRIGALTHIDFTDLADFELAWRKLLSALEVLPGQLDQKAIPPEVQSELDKAKALTNVDNYSEAIPILETALIAADSTEHAVARVKIRHKLAMALYEAREDFRGAERHFRDALALVPLDKHGLKQNVLHGLGEMLLFSGRLDEARATIDAALDAAKLSGNVEDLAGSLLSLSLLERELGFHDRARAKLDEGMQLLFKRALSLRDDEKQHHAHMLAVCYINKALLCREAGDSHEALALLEKAEKQHLVSGEKLDAGKALLLRGEICCANADWGDGFKCFDRGFKLFREAKNTLWGARALELISRLYATHEKWEEALHAMNGAALGAAESGHPGEQIHFLCLAAKLMRKWKAQEARTNFTRAAFKDLKRLPEDQQGDEMVAGMSERIRAASEAIEKAVREDDQARDLLNEAKEIAKRERLHKHLANCLLDEAHHVTAPDDTESRHRLFREAIELLAEELKEAQSPKRRGHLMGRISTLHRELGDNVEAMSWLRKAGEVFDKCGDASGLANFYGSLAELHRAEGRLDDEIADYRKVLSIVESRSFHDLAAGARINLAAALRYRRQFGEAQKLLTEAEALSERHHFDDFISAIARSRSDIEAELEAAQTPAYTLSEMLASLDALVRYHPERATAYLLFWYVTWQTELMALMRSGPHLSFMVITDDVDRFLRFAAKFGHLADYFVMTTSGEFTVKVGPGVLAIPPTWRFPRNFRFFGVRRVPAASQPAQPDDEDALPNYRLVGPAVTMPLFTFVKAKSDIEGEGHVMTSSTTYLPQEAIDLMIGRAAEELVERRAIWFPADRSSSDDRLLTDLRIGRERGVFPAYCGRLPTSDDVVDCGGTQISIPSALLDGDDSTLAAKWRRALLKLAKANKDGAQSALLDLPDLFQETHGRATDSLQIEIRLFEFTEIGGGRQCYPAIVVREE
jgi:tetratricopeptide (TPR) repeat protein